MNLLRASFWGIGLLIAAGAGGCSALPEPLGGDEEDPRVFPEEIQLVLQEVDKLQSKGSLREAIEVVERSLVDYPDSSPLRMRLAEFRSMRQVCFVSDWSEADLLCEKQSPATAMVVLKRIERYGDKEMVHRALERIGEIRSRNPGL